jgi:hypothetical protein
MVTGRRAPLKGRGDTLHPTTPVHESEVAKGVGNAIGQNTYVLKACVDMLTDMSDPVKAWGLRRPIFAFLGNE